jgi:hypothetical protein
MSNLPPAAEIREAIRLRIEQVLVNDHPSTTETVAFDKVVNGQLHETRAHVYKVEDSRIDGQLPSKAFFTSDGLVLTFYCSSSLPNRARPFAGGPVYVMWFDVGPTETYEYDGEVRMFIDQVHVPGRGVVYVVMFGQEQYDQIVLKEPT